MGEIFLAKIIFTNISIVINFLKMEYRTVGKTALKVSCLALGTDNFADPTPEKEASKILEISINEGINLT